ncbi:MAG: hypothetical protein ACFFCO_11680, partial [Promethearchaeota archaeon]
MSVRKFVQRIFSIGMGVAYAEMDAWYRIYFELGDIKLMETDWLQHLENVSRGLSGYVNQFQRWMDHLDRISSNLRLSKATRDEVIFQKTSLLPFIEKQDFSLDYLHWVVSDAITDLSILVDQTEELTPCIAPLLESARELECKRLKNLEVLFREFSEKYRSDAYRSFNQTLVTAYKSQDAHQIKRLLSMYFDLFSIIRFTKPFLLDSDSTPIEFDGLLFQQLVRIFEMVRRWGTKIGELKTVRP